MTKGASAGWERASADVAALSAGLVGEGIMVLAWAGVVLLGTFWLQTLTPTGASPILRTEPLPPREVFQRNHFSRLFCKAFL